MKRFWIFLIGIFAFFVEAKAQFGFPYCETFQTTSTQANTVFGGNAVLVDGVLRLTNNQNNQVGYVYIDVPFPSAYGIKAEFEYFSYGGAGQFLADGLSIFLFDAATQNFSPGGFGGSLGYAQRNEEPGLTNAYLGIGFDEFGNFGNRAEGKNGGFQGVVDELVPDAIVVRGPGNGFNGYPFIVGRKTMASGTDKDGFNPGAQFPISSGGAGTFRVTDPNQPGYRKVFLELQPDPDGVGYFLTLRMQVTTEPNQPRTVTIFDRPYDFPAPNELKIGFAASTGGYTNFHEIRNLVVEVSADDSLRDPVGVDFSDVASCEGQENQYYITDEEVVLPNTGSQIRCLQFFESLEDIQDNNADRCNQGKCLEENQVLVLPQGTLRAGELGAYTFFPNPGNRDQSVEVYYTITDNYGKTSSGNKITLNIQESPAPVRILASDQENPLEESYNLCPGESVRFVSEGDELYERYEWYRDGELLENEVGADLVIEEPGLYEIWAYNRKNCPAKSNQIEVKYPEYPTLQMAGTVVGCEPGESVDVLNSLLTFDPENYDYRLTGNGLTLLNEEIGSVDFSGLYLLSAKPKEFDCFGDPIEVEVFIQDIPLSADFDFAVAGTDIKDDTSGGIFADDPIAFEDLSDQRAVKWIWDFGDGNTSIEQNPIHIFGKKGEFQVVLTIEDEYGCQVSISKVVSITKSYRIMVPTGFTPLEEQNQFFTPKYKGLISIDLMVFNSWGELIFRSDELGGEGWDGTFQGEVLDAGFYVFRLDGVSIDGEKVTRSGKFRLIR
ncbi:PKD domain-containing protein [Algoriphagus limi]|uniref:PKD domain-containing protein n=1 Tax=Algoriphagus limi TaxID=2975273 RepID=A0ABT2GAX1_9BACT|nr:PKD domain-containing protein [Algoriphagus limi]MCS5491918.1 PKD domain-containing protein [Algoriphagus limi]